VKLEVGLGLGEGEGEVPPLLVKPLEDDESVVLACIL